MPTVNVYGWHPKAGRNPHSMFMGVVLGRGEVSPVGRSPEHAPLHALPQHTPTPFAFHLNAVLPAVHTYPYPPRKKLVAKNPTWEKNSAGKTQQKRPAPRVNIYAS